MVWSLPAEQATRMLSFVVPRENTPRPVVKPTSANQMTEHAAKCPPLRPSSKVQRTKRGIRSKVLLPISPLIDTYLVPEAPQGA
eukprot:3739271-Prymnesium_polylepis.1